MFNVGRVDHIGIAVKDIEQAKKFYTEFLGMKALGEEVDEEQKVKVCFIPCGDSEIELLESTSPDGTHREKRRRNSTHCIKSG